MEHYQLLVLVYTVQFTNAECLSVLHVLLCCRHTYIDMSMVHMCVSDTCFVCAQQGL